MYSGLLKAAAESYLVDLFGGASQFADAEQTEILVNTAMHIITDLPWGVVPDLVAVEVSAEDSDNADDTIHPGSRGAE